MTEHFEQSRFAYAQTLKNTLTENHIRKIAHNIIQLNKSRPNVAQENIKIIRKKIAESKTNRFQVTVDKARKLAELSEYAAMITSSKVGV